MESVLDFPSREFTRRPQNASDLVKRYKAVGQESEEGKALYALTIRMVDIFKDKRKASHSNEASRLSKILPDSEYTGLLEAFINAVSQGAIDKVLVDSRLLIDLCYVLRASNDTLSKSHLLKLSLGNLHTRIQGAEGALEKQYQLICTLASLLDAMVDIKISDVSREEIHEPLLKRLRALRKHSEPRLAQASTYAYEALRRVPDDEGQWQALCRYSWMVLEPTAKIAGAITTMDPSQMANATTAIFNLLDRLKKVIEAGRDVYTASESLQDLFLQTLGHLPTENMWYAVLRYSAVLIEDHAFNTLKDLLPRLRCVRNESFWCGLYAQLERTWKKDKETRGRIESLIEWTLCEFPVQKSCPRQAGSKYATFQTWVSIVADTLGKPDWKKSQPRQSWISRHLKPAECVSTLEVFCQSEKSVAMNDNDLLSKAWSKCETAQVFYAQVAVVEHYTKCNHLEITRLSGALLSIEQCYINLAIIESSAKNRESLDPMAQRQAELSLFQQLRVERPDEKNELRLKDLFNGRTLQNGQSGRPKRVLIRGRAGVGKTTLCKKIMYEFHHNNMWKDHFKHIFWIPLRRLKGQTDLEGFLRQEYFLLHEEKEVLVQALRGVVMDQKESLLILDGLDEITGEKSGFGNELTQFFVDLFSRDNIIVTSRPYAALPSGGRPFDLELETIGFRPEQVNEYIKAVVGQEASENIEQFIAQFPIIQGLVQIPIQLDALCFGWDENDKDFLPGLPKTMTNLYQAIELKLWRKDMQQLHGKSFTEVQFYHSLEQVKTEMHDEVELIEELAFYGLVNNIIEFEHTHRKALYTQFPRLNDGHLNKMSFLRTSDGISDDTKNYHFLHLTFQEFFAAKYFVRFWISGKSIPYARIHENRSTTRAVLVPEEFIRREKYAPRYNIMWRFVTGLLFTNKEKLLDFLNALDGEPRDIFRSAQLRLLMHCVGEMSLSNDEKLLKDFVQEVENRLLQHFLANVPEPKYAQKYAALAREMEFPEHLIHKALLGQTPQYDDYGFFGFLLERFKSSTLPEALVECLISRQHPHLINIVGAYHESFPTLALEYLNSPDFETRKQFYFGLEKSESLPQIFVDGIMHNSDKDHWFPTTLVALNPHLWAGAREFLISKLWDKEFSLDGFGIYKKEGCSFLTTKDTLTVALLLLDHNDQEMRARGVDLLQHHKDLDFTVLQKLLILMRSEAFGSMVLRPFESIFCSIGEVFIKQQDLPASVLQDVLEFCRRERFIGFDSSKFCALLMKYSFLQDQDYEALFLNGAWRECLLYCEDYLPGLLHRFSDRVLAELSNNDLSVVRHTVLSMRWLSDLPESIVNFLVSFINDDTFSLGNLAVEVLGSLNLSSDTARSLVPGISEKFEYVSVFKSSRTVPGDVLELLLAHLEMNADGERTAKFRVNCDTLRRILWNQSKLPIRIIHHLLSFMEIEVAPGWAPILAESILKYRTDFYSMLPGLGQLTWQTLFKIWTDRSISEILNVYASEDILYLNMPEGSWQVRVDTPEVSEKLQCGIRAAQQRLRELQAIS